MARTLDRRSVAVDPFGADPADRPFLRWAGYSGLLASLAFLTTVVVTNVSGVPAPESTPGIVAYLEEVSDVAWSAYTYGIAGIIFTVLYVPMAVGVHRLLGRTPAAWYGSGAVIVGLAVLFPAYVGSIVLPAGLAPAAAEVGVEGAAALYVVNSYGAAAATVFFAVGSVLSLGFGPLLWGAEWLRVRPSQRWLGWVALVTGATGMVWFAPGVATPLLVIVIIANVLVSLVCFTGMSIVLVSEGRTATPGH